VEEGGRVKQGQDLVFYSKREEGDKCGQLESHAMATAIAAQIWDVPQRYAIWAIGYSAD
jgi:hypothetical protein